MKNTCTPFLQWALPHLHLRWAGFRKVRKQVCKRLRRRMGQVGLQSYAEYREWLKDHPSEWKVLDSMCRITISRFYRDWDVFDYLKDRLLPQLASKATAEKRPLRVWSAGCMSGEEPYTLSLIRNFVVEKAFPELGFQIIATDVDEEMLSRAATACYPEGSLKGLPEAWRREAFLQKGELYCLQDRFKRGIEWLQQDIRTAQAPGKFDLILCRNLVATYFEPALQVEVFEKMNAHSRPGGSLVLGCHEKLPEGLAGFSVQVGKLNIYEKDQ